ncbi:hypothetical protein [Luteolibacter soli]|uniref:Uncharacterized protein n=1 Tax=Luteolibacter soli TaxID=3135280 RepID=A0ABU9ATV4_9BACT
MTLSAAFALDAPLQYADLAKEGIKKVEWKRLKKDEVEAFYKAYPADREMLDRVTLGDEITGPLDECIAGEAPPLAEALKKFPLHYPLMGRMKNITGTFEWQGRSLVFRTTGQLYAIDEPGIVLRLKQMGATAKSGPRQGTVEAVWFVNRLDGLRILYLQRVELR